MTHHVIDEGSTDADREQAKRVVGGGADSGDASEGSSVALSAASTPPVEEHHASNGEQASGQPEGATPDAGPVPVGDLDQPGVSSSASGESAEGATPLESAGRGVPARVPPAAQSSKRTKPAHQIPMRDAADDLQVAAVSLARLADDCHNGGDLADYLLTESDDRVESLLADLEKYAFNTAVNKARAA
jgi:hypothetical protein